jgi:GntR family transcriptional regulator
MITVDRSSGKSVAEQLVDQLRFLIASGKYTEGDQLPSTRLLARQIDVSFHTVRAAYQKLSEDGILRAVPGSGYTVAKRAPLSKEQRLERGAAIAHDSLIRLTALGLSEHEIAYLFDEQRGLLETSADVPRVVTASPCLEISERFAEQLLERLQVDAEAIPLDRLGRHSDADFVVTPYAWVREVKTALPDSEVLGVEYSVGSGVLDYVSSLLAEQTLGLLVRDATSIRPLVDLIRRAAGFAGDIIASTVDVEATEIVQRFSACEIVAVSPGVRRRVPGALRKTRRTVMLDGGMTEESLVRIRGLLPR